MGAVHVHEFMSLDGVFQDPSWTFPFGFHPRLGERLGAVTDRCEGILLGRKTFEMFAPAWSGRTIEDDPGAPFFNDSTKHVVSGTLDDAEAVWRNSEVVGPYDAEVLRKLKDSTERDLYISGSGQLVRAMLADGLIDHLHLIVYPVALGTGDKLFRDGSPEVTMELVDSEAFDNGVLYLDYAPKQ
ncbi:MAG TPA: dihydrofolate reductase family protein [Nocardioidaceae bacterium]|nr:dihydrofolate reductase family protein [Nocardioidaceae bacterium]